MTNERADILSSRRAPPTSHDTRRPLPGRPISDARRKAAVCIRTGRQENEVPAPRSDSVITSSANLAPTSFLTSPTSPPFPSFLPFALLPAGLCVSTSTESTHAEGQTIRLIVEGVAVLNPKRGFLGVDPSPPIVVHIPGYARMLSSVRGF